jgi:hypothetical protein
LTEQPQFDELKQRISRDIDHYNRQLPKENALAWYGYLAALIEWGMISVTDHERLCRMLPLIKCNPATMILLGRDD